MITLHYYHNWTDERNYNSDMDLVFKNFNELRKYLRRAHHININDTLLNYDSSEDFTAFMINLKDLDNTYLNIEISKDVK